MDISEDLNSLGKSQRNWFSKWSPLYGTNRLLWHLSILLCCEQIHLYLFCPFAVSIAVVVMNIVVVVCDNYLFDYIMNIIKKFITGRSTSGRVQVAVATRWL